MKITRKGDGLIPAAILIYYYSTSTREQGGSSVGIVVDHQQQIGNATTHISDYSGRIAEVIDEEARKAKLLAEQEAMDIVTKAREQAKQITEQALAKAEKESAEYLTELTQKTEQRAATLEEEARNKAESESATIIVKSFDEAEKILTKARQVAELEANKILSYSRKNADEVISKLLKEFEDCTSIISEVKLRLERAVKVDEPTNGKDPEHPGETLTQPSFVEEKVAVSGHTVQVEASPAPAETGSTKHYHGEVKLEVTSPGGIGEAGMFWEQLRKVPNIELESLGSFAQGKITATINIAEPVPLIGIIKEMPLVESVVEHGDSINVVLKMK
jgi:vacuolar-type H+-ATPase subunit H